MNLKINSGCGESIITVDHTADKVTLVIKSYCQGQHLITHSVTFTHPEFALSLAERIREVATAAKIYEENNPE